MRSSPCGVHVPVPRRLFLAFFSCALAGALSCRRCDEEEEEERDQARDNFWRAQIVLVGRGRVKTSRDTFDCASDGQTTAGNCGPTLVRFKELEPPLLEAIAAPGWRFDHWASTIREPDGAVSPRRGKMPDGPKYMNGFGYEDTGQSETVTAVFVAATPLPSRPDSGWVAEPGNEDAGASHQAPRGE